MRLRPTLKHNVILARDRHPRYWGKALVLHLQNPMTLVIRDLSDLGYRVVASAEPIRRGGLYATVRLDFTDCHYRSQRIWFLCLVRNCERVVAVLNLAGSKLLAVDV